MEENQEKINQANETNTTELTDSNININNEKINTENVDTNNNTNNNENQQKNENEIKSTEENTTDTNKPQINEEKNEEQKNEEEEKKEEQNNQEAKEENNNKENKDNDKIEEAKNQEQNNNEPTNGEKKEEKNGEQINQEQTEQLNDEQLNKENQEQNKADEENQQQENNEEKKEEQNNENQINDKPKEDKKENEDNKIEEKNEEEKNEEEEEKNNDENNNPEIQNENHEGYEEIKNNSINDDNNEKEEKKEEEKEEEKKEEEKVEEEKSRSKFEMEGAKPPLSMYTRRVMNASKIKDFLDENSSRGQVGGRNLGNTCFMNSSIACLSNCTELTYYFLKGDYLKDINENNNLGMRGRLAEEWGKLMKQYWVEDTRVGDPSDFKYIIGQKCERFRGYGQQDSNEFMSVFLDCLNEDLNATTKKEYVELKEKGDNETDEECARRFWEINLKRNDSIVTDLFCGQFKSTITCPQCGWINITFDPFDTINLPLLTQIKKHSGWGSENVEEFNFFYVPKNVIREPICLKIKNISNEEYISSVLDRIKKEKTFFYHDKIEDLLMVDILRKEKYGYAEKTQIVRQFVYDEEFIYSFDINRQKDTVLLPVFFYDKQLEKENKSGYPRMVICQKDQTLNDIKKKIYFYLRKYILSPFLKENEEKDELSLEIEKYMLDKNNELPDDIIYEKIEEEFNKVFKKYNENEDEEKSDDEEKKEDDDKDKEERSDEDKNRDEEEERERERNNEEEKEKTDEEKLDENKEKDNDDKKNEEEKNNQEDENKDNKDKEESNENNEKKDGKLNPAEEKKENEPNQNNEENNKKEEGTEKANEEKTPSEDDILKKHIEDFKSDIPFKIFIRRERDENFYYGKTPFIDSKHFSRYSKKLKEFLRIEDFNCPLSDIQTDISDYEVIVQFNSDSKYINKSAFDLDHYYPVEFEYKIKQVEEKKEKTEEEEDDGRMTLAKCLKKFCKEEQLAEGDEWYCSKCKAHVLAKKKMDLYYVPKILIICFKRFVKESSYRWEKNEDEVEFPIHDLDLKDFVIGPDKEHSKYDLFAVSQHYGGTGGGHYTAVCKNDGKWFSYNDSSCSETTESECQSSAAYVLFYRRQTD